MDRLFVSAKGGDVFLCPGDRSYHEIILREGFRDVGAYNPHDRQPASAPHFVSMPAACVARPVTCDRFAAAGIAQDVKTLLCTGVAGGSRVVDSYACRFIAAWMRAGWSAGSRGSERWSSGPTTCTGRRLSLRRARSRCRRREHGHGAPSMHDQFGQMSEL